MSEYGGNHSIKEQETESMKSLEARYLFAELNNNELILEYNISRNSILFATSRVEGIYGIPQNLEQGPELLVSRGIVHQNSANEFLNLFSMIRAGVPQTQCVVQTRDASGKELWGEVILTSVFNRDGHVVKAIGILRDITTQREQELERKREMRHCEVIKKCALLSYEIDLTNNRILAGLEKLEPFGVQPSQNFNEALEQLMQCLVWPEDYDYVRSLFSGECLMKLRQAGHDNVEGEYRRYVNGMPRWVRCTVYFAHDSDTDALLGYYYIHEIQNMRAQGYLSEGLPQQDELTGVYSYEEVAKQVHRHMSQESQTDNRISALYLLDIDGFGRVNEQMGALFGDAVISEVANQLKAQFRSDDILGRVEEDMFILFIKNLPDRKAAEAKGKGICATLRYAYDGILKDLNITVSIGIAIAPKHGITFETLYQKAESALYMAKKQKNTYVCYEPATADTAYLEQRVASDYGCGRLNHNAFFENISEYVFHILYDSEDTKQSVLTVLQLISEHMGFGRSYIYERWYDDSYIITYEWDADGITSLQRSNRLLSGALRDGYEKRFSDQTFFMQLGTEALFPEEQGLQAFDQLRSRIQFSLCENDCGIYGILGFDQYSGSRQITGPEVIALERAVRILDTFLWKQSMLSRLSEQDKMLEAITDSWRSCTYIIEPESYTLRFVNQNTRKHIPTAVPGACCYEAIRGRTAPCEDCPFHSTEILGFGEYKGEMYLDSYEMWAKIHAMIIEVGEGRKFGVFNGYDFSNGEMRREDALREAEAFTGDVALYRALCHSTDDYIFMCDLTKNLFYFPPAMVEDFNLPSKVITDAIPLWNSLIHENDQKAFMEDISALLEGRSNSHNIEYRVKNREGNWVWLRCRGYVQRSEGDSLFAGVITNLGKKSKIDYLSGLPNKYEFELYVRSQISDVPQGGDILLMGLDNFKNINNLYGWEFGDRILRQTAQKIQDLLPCHLQLYRMDGDCFGIYTSRDGRCSVASIFQLISRAFSQQQEYENHRYYCTISGGHASSAGGKVSFHALFKQAEFALEHSKMEGKNRLSCYDAEIMGKKERTLDLIEALRESVDRGCEGFELYFQPQIDAKTRVVESAEALLRWRCEAYGMISPVEFIPILEDTGLIQIVGRWVILKAAEVVRAWRVVRPDFNMNVNVSYAQLQDKSFLPFIEEAIASGNVEPKSLHLELTESCIATGSQVLKDSFDKLRRMGFCMELDDFGTGYSALEILKTAPADVVKIDRTFVTDIVNSSFDATFIQFVVALCHSVNIRVCLEGVETWEEYQMVEAMQVDLIQGFLFGRPQSREDFESKYLVTV